MAPDAPKPSPEQLRARRRLRMAQSGLAFGVLLAMQVLLLIEAHAGLINPDPVPTFIAVSTLVSSTLYVLVRSGLSERISRDPSLSVPQMIVAMACTAWAYALAGPARAALLPLMPLILVFSMFVLNQASALGPVLLGSAMLALAAGALALDDPASYPPMIEAAHWLFTTVAMAAVNVLAGRLGRMRQRLRERQAELTEALAQIQALATRDALTGLLNRRAMMDELQSEARRMARQPKCMTLVLVDLDNFKRINDQLGHRMGDRVLQAFAEVARSGLRASDQVARWGGEEFLLMLPQSDPVYAVEAVERIRTALRAAPLAGAPSDLTVTFSAGLAVCIGEGDIEAAIERADLAMYRAKTGGRNRTEQAEAVNAPAPAAAAAVEAATEEVA